MCFSKKVLCKHEANPQENNNAEAQSQQSRFATLLKFLPRRDKPPNIRSRSAKHSPPGEHLWGTVSACQKNFKIHYNKFLFTVVKRISLTLKANK